VTRGGINLRLRQARKTLDRPVATRACKCQDAAVNVTKATRTRWLSPTKCHRVQRPNQNGSRLTSNQLRHKIIAATGRLPSTGVT
jgi:hypothetical protein